MPFYENMNWDLQSMLYCFAASIGDVLMTLIIFFTVGYLVKNKNWLLRFNSKNILFMLITSLLLSLIVEEIAIRLSLWSYTDLMPKIYITNIKIGIIPLLQMIILPFLVFKLTVLTANNSIKQKNKY